MAQGYQANLPQRLWDSNGDPAVGWKITTLTAGTSTPVTTYSNAALTSANTNPIITNASGFFRLFVAEAVVLDLDVTDDADVPQTDYSIDGIEAMPDTTSAAGSVTAVPAGGMIMYGAATAPTGFLLCDGSLVSRATYSALFTAISTTYGAGDGSTTFGLPDMRGRFPIGKAASGTGSTLGGTGGTIDHTHTGPSHTHATTVPRDGWGQALNTPATTGRMEAGYASGAGQFSSAYQATADQAITSAAGGTGVTGTGNPPFQCFCFIIKT